MSQVSSGGMGAGSVAGAVSGVAVTTLPFTGVVQQQNNVVVAVIIVCGAVIAISSIARIIIVQRKR